jgi:sigma-B regulation protein RsbU (phosphoserine phosphatase)
MSAKHPGDVTARDVMQTDPVVVAPAATVAEVIAVMAARDRGAVLVVDGGRLVGIFTDRDFVRRVAAATPPWREVPIADWMTPSPHTVAPDTGWEDAVARMQELGIRHLPVVDGGTVLGVVSSRLVMNHRGEVLKQRIEEHTHQLRSVNDQLLARDGEMAHSLKTAGRLQAKILLPTAAPHRPGLRWAVHYRPFDFLGGDYYDFAVTPGGVGFLIADASGHSIAAAIVAMLARFAFTLAEPKADPCAVLGAMNERLLEVAEERFVTACYGVFDEATGDFRHAAAGHPHPLRFDAATGEVTQLCASGFLLGVVPGEVYAVTTTHLNAGDKLLFTTDGVLEACNEIGEEFGTGRLTECLRRTGRHPAGQVVEEVVAALDTFRGDARFSDDVTLAVAEVGP